MAPSKTVLNQIVAIEKGARTDAHRALTDAYHLFQRGSSGVDGLTRTYQPKAEDGDPLPNEVSLVTTKVTTLVEDLTAVLTRMFDVVATKDATNCIAVADVVVDGKVLLQNIPVTHLLFLEKQLIDLAAFVGKIPTLSLADNWAFDPNEGVWKSDPTQTIRNKKTMKVLTKAPATDKHPAQTEVYTEDVPEGTWTVVKSSGAVPITVVREVQARIADVLQAVRFAREVANGTLVTDMKVGQPLLDHIFAPLKN